MNRVVWVSLLLCSVARAQRPASSEIHSLGKSARSDAAEAVAIARSCVRRAGAEPERARDFLSRVRRAAWWPELRLGAERDLGTRELIDPSDRTRYGAYAVEELRLEARATWHLDRLTFDPEELRASRESIRLAELRQELALTAVRLYFERRRLELEDDLGAAETPREEALRQARIAELRASLEALCGAKEAKGVLDKRRRPRFACDLAAQIEVGGQKMPARSVDISRGGMCLSSDRAVPVRAEVKVELTLIFDSNTSSEPLLLPGRVVWCTELANEHQVGCMFNALTTEQARDLEMFLRFLRGEVLANGDPTATVEDDIEDEKDPDSEPFG